MHLISFFYFIFKFYFADFQMYHGRPTDLKRSNEKKMDTNKEIIMTITQKKICILILNQAHWMRRQKKKHELTNLGNGRKFPTWKQKKNKQ